MVLCLFVLLGGFNVFVCFVCELLCAVVWCNLIVVRVCVRVMCLRVLCEVLCDLVGFVLLLLLCVLHVLFVWVFCIYVRVMC